MYATRYFLDFAGYNIMCSDITQDLINEYYLHLQQSYKATTINSYVFKISPTILYGVDVRKGMSPLALRRITGHKSTKMLEKYYQFNPTDLINVVDEFNPLEDFKPKTRRY